MRIKSVTRRISHDPVYDIEVNTPDHTFMIDDTRVENCRLKSNITDLGWASSIGGGALRVGSVKVSTVNLARLAYEHKGDEKNYIKNLKRRVYIDLVALDAQRSIIKRNIEKGLAKNYCDGLIDIKTQYSTIGVIGVYEALATMGYTQKDELGNVSYTEDGFRFGKQIFDTINEVKTDFLLDKDYLVNIEQIPGESAAIKLQQADILLFGRRKVNTELPGMGNQFMPLGIKATLDTRIKTASAFDEYCNGGSILHVNIDAPFTNFDQAWKMTNYIADQGVTYFAYNTTINACKHNHAFYGDTCPVCGEPVAEKYTRIVGFLVPVSSWSKERKEEYTMRQWADVNSFD